MSALSLTSTPESVRPQQLWGPTLQLVSSAAQQARIDGPESQSHLRAVINEAIVLFRQAHPEGPALQIATSVPDGLPALTVSPPRLRQVLRMLLRLAAASMPSGGALEVVAEAAAPDSTGSWVQVLIRSAEMAMPTQSIMDHPVSGLTAARSFAESFGGRIYCRARQGAGPEFVVMIPRN
ncbi:MAG: hypothetical protein JJU22_06350 [Gammaproteobacteria bacterium]|jgi:hypothetical protein|nr:hypothetical protein [Gammaproteobacteria bacterium]